MTATFLVTLNVSSDDAAGLSVDADQIDDACAMAGLDVVEVKPWARSTTPPGPGGMAPSTIPV